MRPVGTTLLLRLLKVMSLFGPGTTTPAFGSSGASGVPSAPSGSTSGASGSASGSSIREGGASGAPYFMSGEATWVSGALNALAPAIGTPREGSKMSN